MYAIEDRHRGPPGANASQLVAKVLEGGSHALGDLAVQRFQVADVQRFSLLFGLGAYGLTTEPMGSPQIARLILPGVRRLNTTIGSRLSMQSEIAVASMTLSPCSSTWRYEMRSNRMA